MKNYIKIEGKEIELSDETIKNFKQQLNVGKDYTIVPAEVAEYCCYFNLRNPKDRTQYLLFSDTSNVFLIEASDTWKEEPSVKLIRANSIKDIRVGDLVRFTDYDDFSQDNEKDDFGLCLVVEINDDEVYFQRWNERGHCESDYFYFCDWDKWEVSRPLGDAE